MSERRAAKRARDDASTADDDDDGACGLCARALATARGDGADDGARATLPGTPVRARERRRFRSMTTPEAGRICGACYQREYRARCRARASAERTCARCGEGNASGRWARSHAPPTKGETVCPKCYESERRARTVATGGRGDGERCARCEKIGPGSEKTYWYRAEFGERRGKRVCQACHKLDYRERLNADPSVFCRGCEKTALVTNYWRRIVGENGATAGHWCDACYKKDRLRRMNADPSVTCATCEATTSGGPEWRRKGDGYVCRTCVSKERTRANRRARGEANRDGNREGDDA
jgi:hypothetical protein